jgi:hypothetical protein
MMATTERVFSILSVLGIIFILATYLLSQQFRRPINRLVFFTSFGNLGMNVAALIAEDGPLAGSESPLCQFQGFMVQMSLKSVLSVLLANAPAGSSEWTLIGASVWR